MLQVGRFAHAFYIVCRAGTDPPDPIYMNGYSRGGHPEKIVILQAGTGVNHTDSGSPAIHFIYPYPVRLSFRVDRPNLPPRGAVIKENHIQKGEWS